MYVDLTESVGVYVWHMTPEWSLMSSCELREIAANAAARVAKVKTPDSRGLEGDNYLAGLGETYL